MYEYVFLIDVGELECEEAMESEHKKNFLKNLVFNNSGMFYFVIDKVLSILTRILLFMIDLNILMCGIIESVIF